MIYLLITEPTPRPLAGQRYGPGLIEVPGSRHRVYRCGSYMISPGWVQLELAQELDGYWDAGPSRVLTATPRLCIATGPGWQVAELNHGVGVPDAGE